MFYTEPQPQPGIVFIVDLYIPTIISFDLNINRKILISKKKQTCAENKTGKKLPHEEHKRNKQKQISNNPNYLLFHIKLQS